MLENGTLASGFGVRSVLKGYRYCPGYIDGMFDWLAFG